MTGKKGDDLSAKTREARPQAAGAVIRCSTFGRSIQQADGKRKSHLEKKFAAELHIGLCQFRGQRFAAKAGPVCALKGQVNRGRDQTPHLVVGKEL